MHLPTRSTCFFFILWPFALPLSCSETSIAGIFKQSMGALNRVGIGLSYRPARLHSLAELVPWIRFLGSLKVQKLGLRIKTLLWHEFRQLTTDCLFTCITFIFILAREVNILIYYSPSWTKNSMAFLKSLYPILPG